jgi:hypothetical protein
MRITFVLGILFLVGFLLLLAVILVVVVEISRRDTRFPNHNYFQLYFHKILYPIYLTHTYSFSSIYYYLYAEVLLTVEVVRIVVIDNHLHSPSIQCLIKEKWAYIVIEMGLKGFEPSTYRL